MISPHLNSTEQIIYDPTGMSYQLAGKRTNQRFLLLLSLYNGVIGSMCSIHVLNEQNRKMYTVNLLLNLHLMVQTVEYQLEFDQLRNTDALLVTW